jgi:hypothetical protein
MTFLKQIEPYRQRIELNVQGKGNVSLEVAKELIPIYNELRVKESVRIYGRQKRAVDIPTVDLSCGSCISEMTKQLNNWINIYDSQIIEFKAVPQAIDYEQPESMPWGAFKTYCVGKGLNCKGKRRYELMEELESL